MTERSLAGPVPKGWAEFGVDLSQYNDVHRNSWRWLADNGATFAMLRAYEGGEGMDERYWEHWTNATNHGIEPGSYLFLRPTRIAPIRTQVEGFLAVTRHGNRALVAVDIENGRGRNPWTKEDDPLRCLRQAVWQIRQALGTRPFIYHDLSFGRKWGLLDSEALQKYPLWAALWPKLPDRSDITLDQVTREFKRAAALWQYGGSGKSVPAPIPRVGKEVAPDLLKGQR